MSRKLNFKKSPVDTRDYILKINERSVENNERIDLSSFCSTIKNQGSIGSCTAHASVALMEFMFKKFNIITDQDLFSEKFVYYTTRVKIENISPTEDSGCYLRDTMKGLRAYGSALEASFPYLKESEKDCDISECPSDSVFNEASKYQIIRYVSISDDNPSVRLDKLKTVLKEGYGFVGGFLFYETTPKINRMCGTGRTDELLWLGTRRSQLSDYPIATRNCNIASKPLYFEKRCENPLSGRK